MVERQGEKAKEIAGKIHWNSVGVREIATYHNSLVQLAEKQQRERELAQEAYLLR